MKICALYEPNEAPGDKEWLKNRFRKEIITWKTPVACVTSLEVSLSKQLLCREGIQV